MKRLAMVFLLSMLVVGCRDRPTVTAPPGATGGIVAHTSGGGQDGANPYFFFLPPLGDKEDPRDRDEHRSHRDRELREFNPALQPVVRVFRLPAGAADGCTFTGAPVYEHVASVERRKEHYQVEWSTRASHLVSGASYRICVFGSTAGQVLGFLDVEPVSGGMRLHRKHDTYLFRDDRTLPIKFRIEMGALCAPDALECGAAGTVTATGSDVTLPSGHAAVSVPAGAVKQGDVVTIVVEKQAPPYGTGTAAECLPTGFGLEQSKGCYHFRTEPANYQFLTDVRVEFCVDPGDLDPNSLAVYKYDGEAPEQLPWADPTHIDCTGFVALNADGTPAPPSFAASLWRGARLLFANPFAPRPLYAAMMFATPKGLGGLAGSFSDFGGAVASEGGLLQADLVGDVPSIASSTTSNLTVEVNVHNIGAGSASNFQVSLQLWRYIADSPDSVMSIVSTNRTLGPGGYLTVTFTIACSSLNTWDWYVLKSKADVYNVVPETDESNNTSPESSPWFQIVSYPNHGYCGS